MRGILCLVIIFFALQSPAETISVRLFRGRTAIHLSGFGIYFQTGNESQNVTSLPRRAEYKIVREGDSWIIGDVKEKSFLTIFGNELLISGEMMRVQNKMIDADLKLVWDSRRKESHLMALLELEDYLKGVLPSEMPTQWPLESLKAQAVAARTYAKNSAQARMGQMFHLDDSINHQVYLLENYERASLAIRNKIDRALAQTRGLYLADSKGDPALTYFHSDCGGVTENPKNVWGTGPYQGLVRDDRCAVNPLSEWQDKIPRQEIEKNLAQIMGVAKKLEAITVGSATESGRIHELLFHFSGGQFRALNSQEFRRVFGFNRVKSTLFEFVLTSKELILKGRGHGHGVGMCQKGARFMALAGFNYASILQRYYPKFKLSKTTDGQNIALAPVRGIRAN